MSTPAPMVLFRQSTLWGTKRGRNALARHDPAGSPRERAYSASDVRSVIEDHEQQPGDDAPSYSLVRVDIDEGGYVIIRAPMSVSEVLLMVNEALSKAGRK